MRIAPSKLSGRMGAGRSPPGQLRTRTSTAGRNTTPPAPPRAAGVRLSPTAPAGWEPVTAEEWMAQFFYHGARYLQVGRAGPPGRDLQPGALPRADTAAVKPVAFLQPTLPQIELLEGLVVHSDSPPAGEFARSNDFFYRLPPLLCLAPRPKLAPLITHCPHPPPPRWLQPY